MSSLVGCYEAAIANKEIHDDANQRKILTIFQQVADALESSRHTWFKQKESVKGFYLHGSVGGGKTFLMDLFYQAVQEPHKQRIHFHQFMQQVDGYLRQLQGQSDPLKKIAKIIAKKARLLCLDEFLVQDIATAMILAELLQYLFAEGIVLGVTSNTPPDDLYLNGLQRIRFLPAIALIHEHCWILKHEASHDYRLGRAPLEKAYLYPLNEETANLMLAQFKSVSKNAVNKAVIKIQGREIPTIKCGDNEVWFDFEVICYLPRSQLDYLEIGDRFHTIFVSNVPVLTVKDTVRALLLTHFIDVMYDKHVRVVLSAAAPIEALYVEGELYRAFQRTKSRLAEIQSLDYLR